MCCSAARASAPSIKTRTGQLSFTYDEEYRQQRRRGGVTPLSLSMPLARRTHGNDVVEPFLRGLLPDNENVLRRWGARHGGAMEQPVRAPARGR